MGFIVGNVQRCLHCGIVHHPQYDCFKDPLGLKKAGEVSPRRDHRAQYPEPLDLKPAWQILELHVGEVCLEKMIGGVRVSILCEDGTAQSQEFTDEEFYRWCKGEQKSYWVPWALSALLWGMLIAGVLSI